MIECIEIYSQLYSDTKVDFITLLQHSAERSSDAFGFAAEWIKLAERSSEKHSSSAQNSLL